MKKIQVSGIKRDGWFWASPQGRENVNELKWIRVESRLILGPGWGKLKEKNLYWPETPLMENVIEANEMLRL